MDKSPFLAMPREQQRSALEAILFASDDALSSRALYKLLVEADEAAARQEQQESGNGTEPEASAASQSSAQTDDTPQIVPLNVQKQNGRQARQKDLTGLFEALVTELNEELESTGRAFRIVRVAGGYQFATTAMHGELVARLVKSKSKRRLSQAALETLAIIAYRQPITKPEIEAIRGVSCNEVVNTLLEKNLVTIAGRSDTIGKPLLYGTTDEFLRAFGLHDISDLPKPRELEELMERRADILNVDTVVFAENENVADFEERLPHHLRSEERGEQQPGESVASPAEPAADTATNEPETAQPATDTEEQSIPEVHTTKETIQSVEPEQQQEKPEEMASEQQEETAEQNGDEQTQHRERKMRALLSMNGR